MPPVDLLRLAEIHFVRDGHRRVSVARAVGWTGIDADVTEVVTRIDPDQLAWALDVNVLLRARVARRLIRRGVTGDKLRRMVRAFSPCRHRTFQTPMGETTIPPHFARASSPETRLGPNPRVSDRDRQDPLLNQFR
jgi:hypothetical protein